MDLSVIIWKNLCFSCKIDIDISKFLLILLLSLSLQRYIMPLCLAACLQRLIAPNREFYFRFNDLRDHFLWDFTGTGLPGKTFLSECEGGDFFSCLSSQYTSLRLYFFCPVFQTLWPFWPNKFWRAFFYGIFLLGR